MNGGQPWGNPVPGFGNFIIGNNGVETKATQVLLSAEKPFTPESNWGATFAYTYTSATQNRDVTQQYGFDEETIAQYPFINSNAAPRHRIVGTGSYGLPWGFLVGGKLTLATPIPIDDMLVLGKPTRPAAAARRFRHAKKLFWLPVARPANHQELSDQPFSLGLCAPGWLERLQLVQLFRYDQQLGENGVPNPNPVPYNYNGNINGVPRTLKLMAGAKF